MILAAFILIGIGMRLQAFDITESEDYDLRSDLRIKSAKGPKIESELPRKTFPWVCDELYKTHEAPFTAIILFKSSGRLLCMGSIIDTKHILTNKRPYERPDISDLRVVLGFYKPWWGENSQVKQVFKIIRHEYEVALLQVKGKIKFTEYVQPVKLPSPLVQKPNTATPPFEEAFPPPYTVVGFFVDRFEPPGEVQNKEMTYEIKQDNFVDFADCKENYTTFQLMPPKLFCCLGEATYCWGGRGSPVLKMGPGFYIQIGVVISDSCTEDATGPSLVARTDVYGEWIRANTFYGAQPT